MCGPAKPQPSISHWRAANTHECQLNRGHITGPIYLVNVTRALARHLAPPFQAKHRRGVKHEHPQVHQSAFRNCEFRRAR